MSRGETLGRRVIFIPFVNHPDSIFVRGGGTGWLLGLAGAPVSLGLFYREQSELVEFKAAELLWGCLSGCRSGKAKEGECSSKVSSSLM